MSNTIKYSESTEQRALNKGNWWIGTGDTNKGPSDVTGYYAGVTPPSSGYTIYTKREDNLPSIFVAQNDQELIFLTNQISELNFTTTQECLNYFQSQDDKLCVNREYENIVTDGLVLNLDAGYIPSYPQSGITWNNISGDDNNGELINGPIYSGGSIVFDGSDDRVILDQELVNENWTISYWQTINFEYSATSIPSLFVNLPETSNDEGTLSIGVGLFQNISYVKIMSDDSILVGGQYGGYDDVVNNTLIKINEDGSIDESFSIRNTPLNGGVWTVNKIDIIPSGDIISSTTNLGTGTGIMLNNPISGYTIGRYNTFGSRICNSFILNENTNSLYILDQWINTYQDQNIEGKIFKVDITTGDIDTNFSASTGFKLTVGKTTTSLNEGVYDGILLSDGGLLCTGIFMEYKGVPCSRIVKINSDTGALDTSFNYGTGFNNTTSRAVQMNDGTIVVVGRFTSYNGTSTNRIIGLNTDGTINNNFNIGGGFNGNVGSIIYDSINDKLFCFGTFTSYNGVSAGRIVKLNSDGSIDTSFDYGSGFNNSTFHGDLDSQGRLVVVGTSITSYNGQTIPRSICRINSDGSLDTTFSSKGFNIFRFRQDTRPRLSNNSLPFYIGFFGINANREVANLPGGILDFNGTKLYTITFDTDNIFRTYINGDLKRTFNTNGIPMALKTKSLFFSQDISDVKIYNRALSETEILQNYNAQKGRFGL